MVNDFNTDRATGKLIIRNLKASVDQELKG